MNNEIKGKSLPLKDVFSKEYEFQIPEYQRPYAWTEEQTESLFDDLYGFYKNDIARNNEYFLGSVVLIKENHNAISKIIDGQQRITTLTILIAVIAYVFNGDKRQKLLKYIYETGNEFEDIEAKPRLKIRKRDNEFFEKYVQCLKISELETLNVENLDSEAKVNICKNSILLLKKIEISFFDKENGLNIAELSDFVRFLTMRCCLVVVETADQNSAFRIFSVLNSRGLSLLPTDILKADIIGVISDNKKNEYSQKWEEIENELTRDGFKDLFSQIRMIRLKAKAKKTILEEFRVNIIPCINPYTAVSFVDDILSPYSEAYRVLKNSDYKTLEYKDEINEVLDWLNKINDTDWLPAAMSFYVKHREKSQNILYFMKKLERLAAYLYLSSKNVNERIERYSKILKEIESKDNTELKSIELTEEEKTTFIGILSSDVYLLQSAKRNYLILRLDRFVSGKEASYKSSVLTIEHVLPQSAEKDPDWLKLWPDIEVRQKWLHKLGNLLPLAKRTNSAAQNYDFKTKKEKYFTSKNGISTYALTTQVLKTDEWTPEIVKDRQNYLIDILKLNWEL